VKVSSGGLTAASAVHGSGGLQWGSGCSVSCPRHAAHVFCCAHGVGPDAHGRGHVLLVGQGVSACGVDCISPGWAVVAAWSWGLRRRILAAMPIQKYLVLCLSVCPRVTTALPEWWSSLARRWRCAQGVSRWCASSGARWGADADAADSVRTQRHMAARLCEATPTHRRGCAGGQQFCFCLLRTHAINCCHATASATFPRCPASTYAPFMTA
jgi:hypothetical protein